MAFRFLLCSVAVAAIALSGCRPRAEFTGELTDALEPAQWSDAQWISAADAPVVTGKVKDGSRAADGASWFVATPVNDGRVVSAKWMTAGLGVYELYVNGQRIGSEILKPGFTHYKKTKISYTYDVTAAIKTSKGAVNQLAVQVTPGWWADKIITRAGSNGMFGKKCAFRGVLQLTYTDGRVECFCTDTLSWKAGIAGPVKHAAIYDGEIYDAREPLGFETPDKLSAPEINREFKGEIVPSTGAEIYFREDLTLSPVKAYTWSEIVGASDEAYGKVVISKEFSAGETITLKPGETLVVDFGQNCSAVPEFVFKAERGTTIHCEMSELLNDGNGAKSRGMDGPEGSVHRLNLRVPEAGMTLDYTFAGGRGYETYRPRCTFFGYRLISLTATGEVKFKTISSVPVTSITREMETGTLVTGNESINKLISNTIWSQRSNYLSVPTDCPQRNERLGWTADTQVFAETGSFFANTDSFLHKWMRDMRDTQSPLGGYPGVAPVAQYGASSKNMMRLGWADAGVIVPWTVWKQFGDTFIIEENWESMEKFMDHVAETGYDHETLVSENGNSQWADWLSYEPLETRSGQAFDYDKNGKKSVKPDALEYWNYLSACYWIIDASMMKDMAVATGKDAAKYEKMVAQVKADTKSRFLNADGTFKCAIFNTMQTPALFALKNGLVDGEAKEALCTRLRVNFAEHDGCLQTGFLGTSILMATLTENGMTDIAYDLLFQRKNPSWLYSIDNGATTIWERWNSYTLENGMGPKDMNSFNHYAYGAVCEWLWETAAGISAVEPGFSRISLKPVPDIRLGGIDAEFDSPSGLIRSSWHYDHASDGTVVWTFTTPVTADVWFPNAETPAEYTPGTYTVKLNVND